MLYCISRKINNRLSLPGADMLKTDLRFSEPMSVYQHLDHCGRRKVRKLCSRWKQAEQVQKELKFDFE